MERKRSSSLETGSTSHGSSGTEYDVFLSFRGPDTRANFTDSLYHTLLDKCINVFIDKQGIDVGEEISPEIFQAIDNSKIGIPIFSRDYAFSSWCLRELEHMMQRWKTNELEVMPIFYDVEPCDVKLETRVYADALTLHKEKRGAEIVQRLGEALGEVTGIKGWDTKNRGHGELARLIAQKVSVKLKVSCVDISDHLVGMDESMNEVVNLLNVESEGVRLIGIWGMGGIGKTTLAKVMCEKLSSNFDGCSFIPNVREASQGSGEKESYATYMWDDCGFFPNEGIEVLLLMSLVKIRGKNRLWMHDQLKDLGRSIVQQENCNDPIKGSRVWWNQQGGPDIVQQKKGTGTIAVYYNKSEVLLQDSVLTSKDFIEVPNIRFLELFDWTLSGDFGDLFSELRWLTWSGYPKEMQATNFCPRNLVILQLHGSSQIDEHWSGWTQLKVATRLKVLDLSDCRMLKETPKLSAFLSLEELILKGCEMLTKLSDSIGMLKYLVKLDVSCTSIVELPTSIVNLKSLKLLKIDGSCMKKLPDCIGMMEKLEKIYGVGCRQLEVIPSDIIGLPSLQILKLTDTRVENILKLTQSLVATRLKVLDLSDCRMLKEIPEFSAFLFLEKLILNGC
ncbi:disease resistance protein RPV1-like isoform X2 [Eucalyptus grandis]|uniref:disease resistance protein RPV1-like isoform X2 n=1 Tax=Eucalyptus grandis TaxID=71139 RepID=UPI00192EC608|nr:disease resistance protein RPV1-like isoform X2 [Eucalyptus grandis]